MIFFDLNKIKKKSKNKPQLTLSTLKTINDKSLGHNQFIGSSYLLNFDALYKVRNTVDILFIDQYITLASKRDYGLYKTYNITYLDLSFFPDIILKNIKYNPLINIKDNKIYFIFETKET